MNTKIIQSLKLCIFTFAFSLASLVFCKSAHSLEITTQVIPTGRSYSFVGGVCNYTYLNSNLANSSINSYSECNYLPSADNNSLGVSIRALIGNNTFDFKKGHFYQGYILFKTRNEYLDKPSAFTPHNYLLDNSNFQLVKAELVSHSSTVADYCRYYYPHFDGSNTGYLCSDTNGLLGNKPWQGDLYEIIFYMKDNYNGRFVYGRPNEKDSAIFELASVTKTWVSDLIEYAPNDDVSQAEQKTEEATDEGQQNSDSAGSDNEQASQNLLQTAGDIISAFSAPATNCSISGDLGNVNLGNLNFCQDKPSAIINAMDAIASVIVAFMVFRIIKRLIGRFTSLSSYGQGGSDG